MTYMPQLRVTVLSAALFLALLSCAAPALAQRVPEVDDVYASGQVLRALGPVSDSTEALSILGRAAPTTKTLRFDFTLTAHTFGTTDSSPLAAISGTVALELDGPRERMHVTYRSVAGGGPPRLAAAQRDAGHWTFREIDSPSQGDALLSATKDEWMDALDLGFLVNGSNSSTTPRQPSASSLSIIDLSAGDSVIGHWADPSRGQHHYMTFDPQTAFPTTLQIWGFSESGAPVQWNLQLRQFQLNPPLPKPALFPKIRN